jgi:type VII secretion integral membrane protein EccD
MAVATRDLARITVDTPQRRLDVAVPSNVPVADLLLALVRAGGERLADAGSGWVVRRADGTLLATSETLQDQGVRDGAVLHLVTAEVAWPELEYDDIADAIAATRTRDRPWNPAATRWAGAVVAALALLAMLAAVVRDQPHRSAAVLAGGAALVLLVAGIVLSRARGDAWSGAAVASIAVPYAFVAGLLASGHVLDARDVLIGCVAAAIVAGIALAAVAPAAEPLIAGLTAALLVAVGAGLDRFTSRADAAALVLGAVVLVAGLIPAASVRLGGLSRWHTDGGTSALADAVARTESVVTGLLGAVAIVALVTGSVLAYAGNAWARALAVIGAIVLGLRAGNYASVRQRLVALVGALASALPVAAWALSSGSAPAAMIGGAALVGVIAILVSTGGFGSSTFARVGDVLEGLGILAVAPLVCGVLGLYARARGLH